MSYTVQKHTHTDDVKPLVKAIMYCILWKALTKYWYLVYLAVVYGMCQLVVVLRTVSVCVWFMRFNVLTCPFLVASRQVHWRSGAPHSGATPLLRRTLPGTTRRRTWRSRRLLLRRPIRGRSGQLCAPDREGQIIFGTWFGRWGDCQGYLLDCDSQGRIFGRHCIGGTAQVIKHKIETLS